MRGFWLILSIAIAWTASGCEDNLPPPALDTLRQPSGLRRSPDGRWLFVTNGNWTLDESGATLVALDLEGLDRGLNAPLAPDAPLSIATPCRLVSTGEATVECDASLLIDPRHTVVLPSGAGNIGLDRPRGSGGPWRLLIPTRAPATITWVDVFPEGDGLRVECGRDQAGQCDDDHAITAIATSPDTELPQEPSRVAVDRLGFRYAYVPHLLGGDLSLITLDGEIGPELTDIERDFYREAPFDDLDAAGGFSVAQRACDPGAPPAQSIDCTRPVLYTSHRFWPGIGMFSVAPGLDVILDHGNRSLMDINVDAVDSRPFMGEVQFEDPSEGNRLLAVHNTPAALTRVDTSLDSRGNARNNVRSTVELCDNPNILTVHDPPDAQAMAFVTCFGDGLVAAVDLGSFQLRASVSVGAGANEMVVDPSRDKLYVANTRENTISVIELDRRRSTFLRERARIGLGVAAADREP